MSSIYTQLIIPIELIDGDLLSDLIFSNNGSGIEERTNLYICSFDGEYDEQLILNKLSNYIDINLVQIEKKQSENWMENWKKNFRPIEIGERFIVRPSWEEHQNSDRIEIIIDPKMAFGTGTHETTQLILKILPNYLKQGDTVLDAGTGSGILAIAAEKLGAKKVFAFDNDPEAIENCIENIELNHCVNTNAEATTIDSVSDQFDLVMANINRNILLDIHHHLNSVLKTNSYLVLSGLLVEDKSAILETYKSLDFIEDIDQGEWSALVFRKVT